MDPNRNQHFYNSSDLEELDQKIHNRFIRNVVKPYSNSIRPKMQHKNSYTIPKASELKQNGMDAPYTNSLPPSSSSLQYQKIPLQAYSPEIKETFRLSPYFTPVGGIHSPSPTSTNPHTVSMTTDPVSFHHPAPRLPHTQVQSFAPVSAEDISCKNIHLHIQQCPVCSQLYQPYNNVLMIIIIILVILLLFLAKKCFHF